MRITQSHIVLNDLRFYAFHGVMPQERRVGGEYSVSLRVETDLSAAMESDQLEATLNYAELYEVVKREMQVPSNLLEHVAGRIAKAVMETFPQVSGLELTVVKLNPPMGADSQGAGVEVMVKR